MRGGRPGLPVPNKPYGLCGRKATLGEEEENLFKFNNEEKIPFLIKSHAFVIINIIYTT